MASMPVSLSALESLFSIALIRLLCSLISSCSCSLMSSSFLFSDASYLYFSATDFEYKSRAFSLSSRSSTFSCSSSIAASRSSSAFLTNSVSPVDASRHRSRSPALEVESKRSSSKSLILLSNSARRLSLWPMSFRSDVFV